MTYELQQINGKIAYVEDLLLKATNTYDIDKFRADLVRLRKTQQKMQWEATKRGEFY